MRGNLGTRVPLWSNGKKKWFQKCNIFWKLVQSYFISITGMKRHFVPFPEKTVICNPGRRWKKLWRWNLGTNCLIESSNWKIHSSEFSHLLSFLKLGKDPSRNCRSGAGLTASFCFMEGESFAEIRNPGCHTRVAGDLSEYMPSTIGNGRNSSTLKDTLCNKFEYGRMYVVQGCYPGTALGTILCSDVDCW